MGFFDRFTDTLDDWDFRWGAAGESLGNSWEAAKTTFLRNRLAPAGSLLMTAFGTEDEKKELEAYHASHSFMSQTLDTLGGAGETVGGVFGALGEIPVLRQGLAFADSAQRELVTRPLATANLVRGDITNRGNIGDIFEAETWREAYNTTTYVTPGQAFVYAQLSNSQAVAEAIGFDVDAQARKNALDSNPTLGIILQDPKSFDPRLYGDGRDVYYQNDLMRGVSGTLDLGITLFLDPTVVGGKFAGAAKMQYLSKPMEAAAVQSGRLDGWVDARKYRAAKQWIREAPSSETVRRRMFNNHYDGDLVSALLFDAAKSQGRYERAGGQIDLYDTTFRALYGDVKAWDTITQEAPRIAAAVGHERAVYTIANAAKNYGLGDRGIDATINNLMETERQAWVDATVNGYGLWGKVQEAPLAGQTVPRLTWTSAWRAGTYNMVQNKAPATLGNWARRGNIFLPSQRSGRMLDLNDPNGVSVFRSVLQQRGLGLSQTEIDRWAGTYARATSSEGRFDAYSAAENYGFRKLAERYGLTTQQIDELLPVINRIRRGNRQILGRSRRYASQDVRELYEEKLKQNKLKSAQQLQTLANDIDKAVKDGKHPDSYFSLPDEFGNLTLVPNDANLRLDQPFTVTQHGETVPMMDWNVLDSALWWHVGFGRGTPATQTSKATWSATVGKNIYGGREYMRAALESIMSVWKVTAILRPGYLPRTISDEMGKMWAVMGLNSTLSTMGRGAKNISYNLRSKGRLFSEIMRRKEAQADAVGAQTVVDAEVVETAGKDFAFRGATQAPTGPINPLGPEEAARIVTAAKAGQSIEDVAPRLLTDAERDIITSGVQQGLSAKKIRGQLEASNAHTVTAPTRPYFEQALSEGIIGVGDYLTQVELHGSAGTLPEGLMAHYSAYKAGTMPAKVFRRRVIDHAMRESDRGVYTNPASIREWIENLEDAHATKKPGKPGEEILIDPFTGGTPDLSPEQRKHVGLDSRQEINPQPRLVRRRDGRIATQEFAVDDVYDFIADNIDELLKPNAILSMAIMPSGRMSIGIARNNNPQLGQIKPGAGVRVKLPGSMREGDLLRDSGTRELHIRTAAGDLTLQGAFMGGEGDRLRKQVSSRGPEGAWVDAVTDTQFARFVEQSGRNVDIGPEDWDSYRVGFERAVNLQLGQDAVAQQFLQNRSYNDVLQWMFNTSEGRAYHYKMGVFRGQFAERVAGIQAMVERYVPFTEQRRGESLALRQKVLDGTATVDDLERVLPRSELPRIHGATIDYATGRGPIMDAMKRGTDKAFKALSDLPNDKLVRFPFAADRYAEHVKTVAETRGVFKAQAGKTFTQADIQSIERVARSRTLRDVQRYLFNANATLDLAKVLRLVVPFGSAIADSALKWGVVLRENPTAFIHIWKLWSLPDRAGMVTDENGNELEVEEGREVWYQVDPLTGERVRLEDHQAKDRYITFRLPSFLSDRFYGDDVQPQVRINKRNVQTFLDLPTAGPIVSVPANKFALENPEFADNKFVKQWILPLGASANSTAALIPSNVQNIRRTVFPNWAKQDREQAEGQAVAIFAADLTSYSLGQRPHPPTFEEARDKAAAMRGLRFWSAFAGGISPQIQSPYQPYVDYYRQLRVQEAELRRKAAQEGRDTAEIPAADQLFYEQMGEEFFALTAAVTRNALGIPATIETNKAHAKYKDLIDKHPDVANLIIGSEGSGEFNRTVYEAQKTREMRPGAGEPMRGRLTLEESWEDVQKRRGWIEYGKMQDLVLNDLERMGFSSVDQTGAESVKAERAKWIEDRMFVESPWGELVLNPWFQDFRTIDTSRMVSRLASFRDIVQDSRLQGRDDIRGLIQYLRLRDRMKSEMGRYGFGSLAADQAAGLRAEWERQLFQLKRQNLAFSALHDRWLTGDESLEAT